MTSIPKMMQIMAKMGLETVIPIFFNPSSTIVMSFPPPIQRFQNTCQLLYKTFDQESLLGAKISSDSESWIIHKFEVPVFPSLFIFYGRRCDG
jgi:hypothetical protein